MPIIDDPDPGFGWLREARDHVVRAWLAVQGRDDELDDEVDELWDLVTRLGGRLQEAQSRPTVRQRSEA